MAAFWATIVSYVLGIPARYYAYAAVAMGIFFVGCHCGRGFGISPQKADPANWGECWMVGEKLSPAERKIVNAVLAEKGLPPVAEPCPVNGSNCTCGCQSGKPCNCAISHVAVERLSRLDPQALAYRDLCEFAERNPQMTVAVYVKADAPLGAYVKGCRYDAGWPSITEPTLIFAQFIDGRFVETGRTPLNRTARPVYFQPFANFGGNCPSGNCRSR